MLWADYNKNRPQALDVMADYTELPYQVVDDAFPEGDADHFEAIQNRMIRNHFLCFGGATVAFGTASAYSLSHIKICESIEQPFETSACKPLVPVSGELAGAGVLLGFVAIYASAFSHLKMKRQILDRAEENVPSSPA